MKRIWFPANLGLVLLNLQLGISGNVSKHVHGVGLGPLSKMLAVKGLEVSQKKDGKI